MSLSNINYNINLYPPIVPDTLPAFIIQKLLDNNSSIPIEIYFEKSIYQSSNITAVHVSITDQSDNQSVLNKNLYPSGIKIKKESQFNVSNKFNDYSLKIDIEKNDFNLEKLNNNKDSYYKIQLRFDSNAIDDKNFSDSNVIENYLNNDNNKINFSEWSKVCLIKGISNKPILELINFSQDDNPLLTNPLLNITGKLNVNKNSTQYLKSYNIKIYLSKDADHPILDSGQILAISDTYHLNEINYSFEEQLTDGMSYIMKFTYTTNNLYSETITYKFSALQYGVDKIEADIIVQNNNDRGCIKIHIQSKPNKYFLGTFTIRRTSSESDFHKWIDVANITYYENKQINQDWYDYTVESGVWYKYCIQKRYSNGGRSTTTIAEKPVMCVFEDIFLTQNNCQLKIQFNPSVTDFKYNVNESQQITLGSQYPFIKRNGSNYYRSFTISGLITSFMDNDFWYNPHYYIDKDSNKSYFELINDQGVFTSKQEIYQNSKNLYKQYNEQNNISDYYDYIYQKKFRDKVYDFLYKNNIKLFRSTTQGNILIKLMNITFQPNEILSRRLYSFSANAIEIDAPTISNYLKYDIFNINPYLTNYTNLRKIFGQYCCNDSAVDIDIFQELQKKYKNNTPKTVTTINSLLWMRIQFIDNPKSIIVNDKIYQDNNTNKTLTSGYLLTIDSKTIIIKPQSIQPLDGNIDNQLVGIFEWQNKNKGIKNLMIPAGSGQFILDYIVVLQESQDKSTIAEKLSYFYNPAQLWGSFNPQESLIKQIKKYREVEYPYNFYTKLIDILNVQIESKQHVVVYIKDQFDTNFNRHELTNGYLKLNNSDVVIKDLYFYGLHFEKNINGIFNIIKQISNRGINIELNENIYNNILDINNPQNGIIYKVSSHYQNEQKILNNTSINEFGLYVSEIETDNGKEYIIFNSELSNKKLIIPSNIYYLYYNFLWIKISTEQDLNKIINNNINSFQLLKPNEYIEITINNNEPQQVFYNKVFDLQLNILFNFKTNYYLDTVKFYNNPKLELYNNSRILNSQNNNFYSLEFVKSFNPVKKLYYNGEIYNINEYNDIQCKIDGIVNYNYQLQKGELKKDVT